MSQFKKCECAKNGGPMEYYNHLCPGCGCRYEAHMFDGFASHLDNVSGRCFIDACEWGGTSSLKYLIKHFEKQHFKRLIDLSTTENYFTIDYKNPVALLTQFNKANFYNALYRIVLHSHKGQKFIMIQYIGKTDEQYINDSLLLKQFTISSYDYPELSLSCEILPKTSCVDDLLCDEYLINNATKIPSLKGDKFKISITGFHLNELSCSSLLRCANCDDTLSVPIRMCKNNHSFCNSCTMYMGFQNKNCKLCDNVVTEERNHNLENLIDTLTSKRRVATASCRYESNGCTITEDETLIIKHENDCKFRKSKWNFFGNKKQKENGAKEHSLSYRVARRIIKSEITTNFFMYLSYFIVPVIVGASAFSYSIWQNEHMTSRPLCCPS